MLKNADSLLRSYCFIVVARWVLIIDSIEEKGLKYYLPILSFIFLLGTYLSLIK